MSEDQSATEIAYPITARQYSMIEEAERAVQLAVERKGLVLQAIAAAFDVPEGTVIESATQDPPQLVFKVPE